MNSITVHALRSLCIGEAGHQRAGARPRSPPSNIAADSFHGSSSNEILRDLHVKDAELESGRRETWM